MGTAFPVAPNSSSASGPCYQSITTDHVSIMFYVLFSDVVNYQHYTMSVTTGGTDGLVD